MRRAALLGAALMLSAQHPADVPPAWEGVPIAPDAPIVPDQILLVRPGDGLLGIAVRTGASAAAIARANALSRPWTLRVNQRLKIPGGRYHLVRPGQSGIAIARAYGVDWSRIATVNALPEPYVLLAGTRLLIPVPATPRSRAAERAAAFRLDVDDILTGGEPAMVAKPRAVAAAKAARPPKRQPPAAAVLPPARLAAGGFVWPVPGGQIIRRFGAGGTGERSDGIDIAVPRATPIRAAADGVVAYAGSGIAALGGLVILRHGSGWTSVYGYADRLVAARGRSVRQGEVIAVSGATGYAGRPAVHFELRRGRLPVDPQTLLPRR